MRVIAGEKRHLLLKTVDSEAVRPTTDKIKETLFNIIQFKLKDVVFVDLFAGSGAIGIEALSRGAKKAYFIDNSPAAAACITENLAFTKLTDRAILFKSDVSSALYNVYEKHVDIIFMDPPYSKGIEKQILELLNTVKYCDDETLIIIESEIHNDFSYVEEMGYEITREKTYKNNKHVFIHKKKV